MAEKNPAKNIDRLRAAPGTEEVIPESSFDQYEPATSYKVGTSTMAVDMTSGDWPLSPLGVVNTTRPSDDFATQSYQPQASSVIYYRRWDKTPIDYSDFFDDGEGVTYDHNKWTITTGTTTPPSQSSSFGGSLHTIRPPGAAPYNGVIGVWYLPGDFDITYEPYLSPDTSSCSAMMMGVKATIDNADRIEDNTTDLTVYAKSSSAGGVWQADSQNVNHALAGAPQYDTNVYLRVTRVSTQIAVYWKINFGDAWTLGWTGGQPSGWAGQNIYVRLTSSSGHATTTYNYYHGSMVLNDVGVSTIVVAESPIGAYWSDWVEIKDADTLNQDTTDAIEIHATVTYDHESLVDGSNEVIPASSFDQDEPATSYKLGTSTLAVDMTFSDWPLTGKGIVNTSRASDDHATQVFQPTGTSLFYNRRWDTTPFDYSDPFEGPLGSSYNTLKWQESDGNGPPFTADLQDANGLRSLRISSWDDAGGLVGTYYFPAGANDFDIQVLLNRVTANNIGGPSIVVGSKADLMQDPGVGYGNFNNDIFGVECNSATYRCFTYGDTDGFSTYTADPVYLRSYFRLVKSGSQVWIYRKQNIEDAWIEVRTSTGMGATFNTTNLYVKLFQSSQKTGDNHFDDYVINSFTALVEENPVGAHWSDWVEQIDADTITQEIDDAIEIHATVTYDHPKIVSDILLKQDIIPVSETEPVAPEENDLWIDTST
jgi:hypothetical protein